MSRNFVPQYDATGRGMRSTQEAAGESVGADDPVAVPGIFVADGAASSSADRGHSLRSLLPPPAALPSLPTSARPEVARLLRWNLVGGNLGEVFYEPIRVHVAVPATGSMWASTPTDTQECVFVVRGAIHARSHRRVSRGGCPHPPDRKSQNCRNEIRLGNVGGGFL